MSWLPDPLVPAADPGRPASPRVAFALARQVGSSVTRNRLRRQLWHHLAERERGADPLPAGDYLVRVGEGGADVDPAQLRADLDAALAEAVSS